jgi:ABC-type thiamin/hydroxymethylpyrimidine transport system permease subunit
VESIRAKKISNAMPSRDLLIIAVLSGIGGVMSTYVGYLGNLLNRIFGVPFGAGQFVSGLHVFWIILVAGLVRRPGAGLAAGLLKGVVELLTGSTHGVAIVLVSLVQGALVDIIIFLVRRHTIYVYALAGGIAAASNVFVFQALYFSGVPFSYLLFISSLAFISGILFAGCFGKGVLDIIMEARPFRMGSLPSEPPKVSPAQAIQRRKATRLNFMITGILVLALSVGAVYYYAVIFDPPWRGPQFSVEGQVENPATFQLAQFSRYETSISAELRGQVTFIPEQEYTGIPLKTILEECRPLRGASLLSVIASDGYQVDFPLQDVLTDDDLILIREGDTLRLIAGKYEGGYWVKQVTRFLIK